MSENEHFGGLPGTAFEGADVDAAQLEQQKLTGIGGWLLLYVVLGCFSVVVGAISFLASFFTLDTAIAFAADVGASSIDWIDLLWIIALSTGLFLLFKRSKQAPKVNIIALAVSVGAGLVKVIIVVSFAGAIMGDMSLAMPLIAGAIGGFVVSTAINVAWIFYFLRSKRVRYTCVL